MRDQLPFRASDGWRSEEPAPEERDVAAVDRNDGGWEELLDVLEGRVQTWRAALDGSAPYPGVLTWPARMGSCPPSLADRARRVLHTQHQLEEEMSARRAMLGSRLGASANSSPTRPPLFVDERS